MGWKTNWSSTCCAWFGCPRYRGRSSSSVHALQNFFLELRRRSTSPPPSENVPPALLRWPGLTAPPEVSGSDVHWTNVHEGDEEWCHTSERGGQDPLSVHQAPRGSSPRGSSGNPNALVLPATYRGETGNPLAQVFLASYASAHITHMSGCGRSRNLTE